MPEGSHPSRGSSRYKGPEAQEVLWVILRLLNHRKKIGFYSETGNLWRVLSRW
jgi:hypothetical protein